jgi:UDP-N-acetylglucosamine/UDP-N-acetylgalactosamine 4-epimerase
MYESLFHSGPIDGFSFLVTGGAGFIGSHICEYLLQHQAGEVRVLDNLSEGRYANIERWIDLPNFKFIEGDITDLDVCQQAVQQIDYISHQAALGSVPRSINTPLATHAANVTGCVNVMTAAKDAGVRRFVYASSSSVYGDSLVLPKCEELIGEPLSPYAASKLVDEIYAAVYGRVYGLETVGLRYFNVFGPRQKPDGPYAAVVPLFIDALLNDRVSHIDGDGEQSRDFTFVANAVEANIRAMFSEIEGATGKVYNVAYGERRTVNELYNVLKSLVQSSVSPAYREPRQGDVRDSLADISSATKFLGYQPQFDIDAGLAITLDWFQTQAARRDPK